MTDRRWTPETVEERLREAADTLRRLPEERIQGFVCLWPSVIRDVREAYGHDAPRLRRGPPLPAAIDRMDETLRWLAWLEPELGRLVWLRLERTPWKGICLRFGISRATAHRRWQYALGLIVWRLNGRQAPSKRSRAFVIDTARRLATI